jgi:hypothetical protein
MPAGRRARTGLRLDAAWRPLHRRQHHVKLDRLDPAIEAPADVDSVALAAVRGYACSDVSSGLCSLRASISA